MKGEGVTEKIDHKPVRVIMRRNAGKEIPPEVVLEDKLVDWAEALHHNAMRITAAGVLASTGSLEKAADVLQWAGYRVPAGYFPDEITDKYWPGDDELLRLWVEAEAERIEGVIGLEGFRLAATGILMDEARDDLEAGDLILKPAAIQALGISPEDLARASRKDEAGVSMVVPDARTEKPVPVPLREMGADDHRRVHEAVEIRKIEAERMEKRAGGLAARMEEHGCGPDVTVGEFLAGEVEGKAAGEPDES